MWGALPALLSAEGATLRIPGRELVEQSASLYRQVLWVIANGAVKRVFIAIAKKTTILI